MSIEDHPNLNAAGLTVDTINALTNRVRGPAKRLFTTAELMALAQLEILRFVERIDQILDTAVTTKTGA